MKALLKYNPYTIPLARLSYIIHWFPYIQSCEPKSTIIETFASPPKETPYPLTVTPLSFQPLTWGNHSFPLSLQICLFATFHIHGITQYVVLCVCLASVIQHSVFKGYPHCSTCQYFISFYCWIIFHGMDTSHFVYPFNWWTCGLFTFFFFF